MPSMSLGVGEIIILGFVLLVVLSAARMGSIGNALGKFVYSFKRAAKGDDTVDVTPRRSGHFQPGKVEDAQIDERDRPR